MWICRDLHKLFTNTWTCDTIRNDIFGVPQINSFTKHFTKNWIAEASRKDLFGETKEIDPRIPALER